MSARPWRVATRRKGHPGADWDIGQVPMTEAAAKAAAKRMNRQYRMYEHRPVKVPKK